MRENRFTFLCNSDERNMLASLAEILQRTQSDVIRLFLREKARELGINFEKNRKIKQAYK